MHTMVMILLQRVPQDPSARIAVILGDILFMLLCALGAYVLYAAIAYIFNSARSDDKKKLKYRTGILPCLAVGIAIGLGRDLYFWATR